jgi:NAD(P)-dependent dehydrogenase (short-subunit alcohol dehydrogenase family)
MKLDTRTAVVTGAASGIGRGIAIELAREGADVVVSDTDEAPPGSDQPTTVEELRDLGAEATFVECDVSDQLEAEALIETAGEEFGGIDVLVNNHSISRPGTVEHLSMEEWHESIAVNLTGKFLCSKYAIPHLRESDQPRIINVSSQVAFVSRPRSAAYATTMAAVSHLTRQMAVDLGSDDVTVNAIAPGPVKTERMKETTQEWILPSRMDNRVVLSTVGEPKDIGRAAVYLASEDARYVTGHNLVVDGGWTVNDLAE